MRLRIPIVIVAALAAAPSAFAHVTISPQRAQPGSDVLLTLVVPNEGAAPVDGVTVVIPRSFDVEGVGGSAGWRLRRAGARYVWSGGTIPPGQLALFTVSGSAPVRSGPVAFRVRTHSAAGEEHYAPRLSVAAPAPAARDSASRTLGEAALFVAIAAAVVAVATFFLVLALWLRGGESLQEGKRDSLLRSEP